MKKVVLCMLLSGALIPVLAQNPEKISCNERIQHGHTGFAKGAVALGCAAVCGWFLWDTWNKAMDLKLVHLSHKQRISKSSLWQGIAANSVASAAFGYLAWTFGKQSKESLTIFYSDSEE